MGSFRRGRTTPAFRLPLLACLALPPSLALGGCAAHYLPPSDIKGSVPEGFVPVDAITCSQDCSEAGGPSTLLVKQQHLMGDCTALLAALAQPSAHGGDWPCTADMEIVPALWLANAAGEAAKVSWPATSLLPGMAP